MPRPPGIIDRVNYVIDMWERPCGASWWVYIRTAGPAFLDLVVFLLCFDLGDIIRYIFRPGYAIARYQRSHPRAARLGGHTSGLSRGGRRRTRSLHRRVTDKLPGMKKLRQRHVTRGVVHLWVIDGVMQRILWYWLLVEGLTGFLYNWTSILYRTEACRSAFGPSIGREAVAPRKIGAFGTHSAIIWKSADDIGDGWQVSQFHTGNPKQTLWHLAIAVELSNTTTKDARARLGVGIGDPDGFKYKTTDWANVIAGATESFAIDIQYRGNVNAPAFVQAYGGPLTLSTALMLIWEATAPQGSPVDLTCTLRDVLSF